MPIVHEVGWARWPVWTGAENLASTGIRSPDRPARNQSLYRLSYPGPLVGDTVWNLFTETVESHDKFYDIVANVSASCLSKKKRKI